MNGVKIILLGKGKSIDKLNKGFILSHDYIAWANIHDCERYSDLIPRKVDYFFIREKYHIDNSDDNVKEMINSLDIPHVILTANGNRVGVNKILKYNVKKHIQPEECGFNASTGVVAFNYLINLKPNILTVAGIDLYPENEELYYFSNQNVEKSKPFRHFPEKSIEFIANKITCNNNINFKYCTTNEKIKNRMKDIKNIEFIFN
ncbi:MAG: hypothetical protein ACOC2W_01545 [bacterium]